MSYKFWDISTLLSAGGFGYVGGLVQKERMLTLLCGIAMAA